MEFSHEQTIKFFKAREFDNEFFKNLIISKSQREAYEKTEKAYHKIFGRNRYKNFESYRKCRDYRMKM